MPATQIKVKKLSTEDLSALYNRIYDIADRLFKKYNPCNIRTKNGKASCTCYLHSKYKDYLCCTDCKYTSPTGCTTKCLACKLFMCPPVSRVNRRLYHQLQRLSRFACKHDLPAGKYFYPKRKWLKEIKNGKQSIHCLVQTKQKYG